MLDTIGRIGFYLFCLSFCIAAWAGAILLIMKVCS